MKTRLALRALLAVLLTGPARAATEAPPLAYRLAVTPEVKKAFAEHDAIEVEEITGTAANFQVGGTYRITGICRQESLTKAVLTIGNTAEPGGVAIVPAAGAYR